MNTRSNMYPSARTWSVYQGWRFDCTYAGYYQVSKAPPPSERYRQFLDLDYARKVVTIEPGDIVNCCG